MAFWGPPFTGTDVHSELACLAALDQLASVVEFRAEMPELIGLRRGFPEIDVRIGIATGDVVVGSIGSETGWLGQWTNDFGRSSASCRLKSMMKRAA